MKQEIVHCPVLFFLTATFVELNSHGNFLLFPSAKYYSHYTYRAYHNGKGWNLGWVYWWGKTVQLVIILTCLWSEEISPFQHWLFFFVLFSLFFLDISAIVWCPVVCDFYFILFFNSIVWLVWVMKVIIMLFFFFNLCFSIKTDWMM